MGEKKTVDINEADKGREALENMEAACNCKIKTSVKAGPSSGAQTPYGTVQGAYQR